MRLSPACARRNPADGATTQGFIYLLHAMDILTNLLLTGVPCFYLWRAKLTTIYKCVACRVGGARARADARGQDTLRGRVDAGVLCQHWFVGNVR